MQQLAEFSACLVSLGTRDRLSMLYLDVVRGPGAVTLSLELGSRIGIVTSALGRAYMAAVAAAERDAILERVRELTLDEHWPGIRAGIDQALADYRRLDVCCSFGEWQPEVNAIAVPVRPGGGLPPMAINCGAPAYIAPREFLLNEVRPRLLAMAAGIKSSLGTAPGP